MGFADFVSEERALEKRPICDKAAVTTKFSFIDLPIKNHRSKLVK